jgi:hypothetical protein
MGLRSELSSVFGLEKVDRWNPIQASDFWTFPTMKRELQGKKRSTVCSTFSRSGWSLARNSSFAKGVLRKKIPSPHLHKVPTQSNMASPRTSQTVLVHFVVRYLHTPIPFGNRSQIPPDSSPIYVRPVQICSRIWPQNALETLGQYVHSSTWMRKFRHTPYS